MSSVEEMKKEYPEFSDEALRICLEDSDTWKEKEKAPSPKLLEESTK